MAQIPHKQRRIIKSNMYRPSDKWNELIKAELTSMGAEYQKLYELRCMKRMHEGDICDILHIKRTTYYQYMRDITENIWATARENELLNM